MQEDICLSGIARDKFVDLSISDTTRPARDNEINGVDYNFINQSNLKKIENNAYIEFANVFGNYYGSQRILLTF